MIENVQSGVRGNAGQGGSANYDVSPNGTLVYVPDFALAAGVPRRLLSVDLSGNSVPLIDDTAYTVLTPDGKSVIYRSGEGHLFRQPTDGGSGAQVLVDPPGSVFRVIDVSRDGVVAVAKGSPQDDIQTFHLSTGVMSEFPPRPLGNTCRVSRPTASGWHTHRTSLAAT
jgi:hypothetical protein